MTIDLRVWYYGMPDTLGGANAFRDLLLYTAIFGTHSRRRVFFCASADDADTHYVDADLCAWYWRYSFPADQYMLLFGFFDCWLTTL